jgi:hypothetical protein
MISWFLDRLEKIVSPIKNSHETVYKEEDIYAYIQEGQPMANTTTTNIAAQQYTQALAQANVYQGNNQLISGHQSTGSYTPYYTVTGTGTLGTPISQLGLVTTPIQTSPSPAMPYPTGIVVHVAFTDANGAIQAILVDQAYAHYFQQISQMHTYGTQTRNGVGYIQPATPSPPTHKMVDGDFSFEEMETAEDIIKELGQGHEACFEAQGSSPD